MPLDIGVLRAQGVPALVTWRGQDIQVRYLPTNHTSEMQQRLEAVEGGEAVLDLILRELVCGWDLLQDGQPLPVTEAVFAELPVTLKAAIVEGVLSDIANPTTGPTSPGASAPTATSSSGTPPPAPSAAPNGRSATPSGSGSAA